MKSSDEMNCKKRKLTKAEQETSIAYTADEKSALVYSSYPKDMDKLERYCEEYPDAYNFEKRDERGIHCFVLKQFISFAKPRKNSPEVQRKRAERMKTVQANK